MRQSKRGHKAKDQAGQKVKLKRPWFRKGSHPSISSTASASPEEDKAEDERKKSSSPRGLDAVAAIVFIAIFVSSL